MNKTELIDKLEGIKYRGSWDDGMGSTKINNFITLPDNVKNDPDIMDALWSAVDARNREQLSSAAEKIDTSTLPEGETPETLAWLQWTNYVIEFDYSDIQELVDAYTAGAVA